MSGDKINVLHLIPTLQIGGGERMVLDIARYQRKNGINAIIGCTENGGKLIFEAKKENIPVIILHGKRSIDLKVLYKIIRLIKFENIQLVHTNFFESDIIGRIAARICSIPCVSTLHNTHSWHFEGGIKNKAKRFVNRLTANHFTSALVVDSVFIQNHYIANLGFKKADNTVLYNPIEANKFLDKGNKKNKLYKELGLSEDNIILINIASLSPQKSQKDFIDIIDIVRKHCPQVRLLIAGGGTLRNDLEESIKKRELAEYIKVLGDRDDIPDLLSISKIFVLSSKWEGLPISVLEAMAAGKPVVATAVGGVPEIIKDNQNGFLVPYGDHDKFAARILELINNRNLLDEMAKKAKTESIKFDISRYHASLLELYPSPKKV